MSKSAEYSIDHQNSPKHVLVKWSNEKLSPKCTTTKTGEWEFAQAGVNSWSKLMQKSHLIYCNECNAVYRNLKTFFSLNYRALGSLLSFHFWTAKRCLLGKGAMSVDENQTKKSIETDRNSSKDVMSGIKERALTKCAQSFAVCITVSNEDKDEFKIFATHWNTNENQ